MLKGTILKKVHARSYISGASSTLGIYSDDEIMDFNLKSDAIIGCWGHRYFEEVNVFSPHFFFLSLSLLFFFMRVNVFFMRVNVFFKIVNNL